MSCWHHANDRAVLEEEYTSDCPDCGASRLKVDLLAEDRCFQSEVLCPECEYAPCEGCWMKV